MSILKAIVDARERFEAGSHTLVPLPGGDKYRLIPEPVAPATKVYLNRPTYYALLAEVDIVTAYEIRYTGRLFGMLVFWCDVAGGEPLPFPYIHVTGG